MGAQFAEEFNFGAGMPDGAERGGAIAQILNPGQVGFHVGNGTIFLQHGLFPDGSGRRDIGPDFWRKFHGISGD